MQNDGNTALQVSPVSRFSELASLFTEAEHNATELASAKVTIQEQNGIIENLRIANSDLHSKVATLTYDMAEVVRERDTFRAQYNDADALVASLRGDYDASQSLLNEAQNTIAGLRKTLSSRDKRIFELEAEVKHLQDYILCLSNKLGQVRYHTREVMGIAEDNWTDPGKPLEDHQNEAPIAPRVEDKGPQIPDPLEVAAQQAPEVASSFPTLPPQSGADGPSIEPSALGTPDPLPNIPASNGDDWKPVGWGNYNTANS